MVEIVEMVEMVEVTIGRGIDSGIVFVYKVTGGVVCALIVTIFDKRVGYTCWLAFEPCVTGLIAQH